MIAWLISLEGETVGKRYSLDSICLVGRGQYNHVVLDDTRISRQHAKIAPEGGQYVLQDLNSANGSYVNEIAVSRQVLMPEDVVRFGPFRFKVEIQRTTLEPRTPEPSFREARTQIGMEAVSYIAREDDSGTGPPMRRTGLLHLEDADRKLRTLYAFLQSVATTIDEEELVDRVLRNLLDVFFEADCVALHLVEEPSRRLAPRMVLRRDGTVPPAFGQPPQVEQLVIKDGRALLLPLGSSSRRTGRSMHVPLVIGGKVAGSLDVRSTEGGDAPFSQGDVELLSGLAVQATMALDNVRMHQQALKQQRLQLDLQLAEQIQKSFLPRHLPSVPGIEFATKYRPAFQVGGDFYDVFWLSYDKIGLLIGDVAGKGVSAALLMARITSDLRLAAMMVPDPAQVLGHVNRIVYERAQSDVFVTVIYMTMDVRKHRVQLANAGHLPPLLRRRFGSRLERIEGGAATAIGIFDDAEFDQVEFDLHPGDTLIFTTDGVVESTNAQGVQFGLAHLERAVASTFTTRPGEIVARIEQDIQAHMGPQPQNDDLTVIACGIAAPVSARIKRNDEPTEPSLRGTYSAGRGSVDD